MPNPLATTTLESTYGTAPSYKLQTNHATFVEFDIIYTLGAAEGNNSLLMKLETSTDGTTWYQTTNGAISGAANVLTQAESSFVGVSPQAYNLAFVVKDITAPYLKISFAESGVAANKGTVSCKVVASVPSPGVL